MTLSGINESFLERAEERCDRAGLSDVRFVVDDIEVTQLMGPYQVIAATLVLEHIDWLRGLRGIHRLVPDHLHIVIQCNPEGLVEAIAPGRKLNLSMQAFADFAHPILVSSKQLIDFLRRLGYRLTAQQDRRVADNKTMLALSFMRDCCAQRCMEKRMNRQRFKQVILSNAKDDSCRDEAICAESKHEIASLYSQ